MSTVRHVRAQYGNRCEQCREPWPCLIARARVAVLKAVRGEITFDEAAVRIGRIRRVVQ